MSNLHPTQKKILKLLKNADEDGISIRDLQDRIGASSPSVVHHHIIQLEKKGYLRRNPNNPKDYQVLADDPEKEVTYLNVYGLAQCGPNGSILDGSPVERIPISSKILGFSSKEAFMVKARGKSMEPLINENDYVVARTRQSYQDGDVVVCVNNGETLIKKISLSDKKPILISLNREFKPMIANDDFRVEGVVKGVYKYPTK